MKLKVIALLAAAALLGGCINTGINVGGVFIPVNSGIGETKPDREKEPDAPPPRAGGEPSPKSVPQSSDEDKESEQQETGDNPPFLSAIF